MSELNLHQRIIEVMKDVEYLQKDDNVSTGGTGSYKAISEEKVTETIRKSLIKNGITIVPVSITHRREDDIYDTVDKYNNPKRVYNRLSTVDVVYQITNIDNIDDKIIAMSSGTGIDSQDKGVGKALTYAYKYLLLRTFAIPTGDDPDKMSSAMYDEQQPQPVKKEQIKKNVDLNVLYSQLVKKHFKSRDEFQFWVEQELSPEFDVTLPANLPELVNALRKLEN